jgi:hypothetical protein
VSRYILILISRILLTQFRSNSCELFECSISF